MLLIYDFFMQNLLDEKDYIFLNIYGGDKTYTPAWEN